MTNQSRRDQIVRSAIAVIAERGYQAATFTSIAGHAGIKSTRTVSYHFTGKDDLVASVVERVLGLIREALEPSTSRGDASATERLAGYIRSVVALSRDYRQEMSALMTIFLEHHPTDGSVVYGTEQEHTVLARVERILLDGQRTGEFTGFDTRVMASVIQRAVDGVPFLLRGCPDLDLDHYARELIALFHRATTTPTPKGEPA